MKVPCIRILGKDLELLAEIDLYTSLLFTRSWQGVGEFEFHTAGNRFVDLLREGAYIMLDNDGHRCGIIRSVQLDSGENGISISVRGQTLDGLATQRYTIPPEETGEVKPNGGYDNVPMLTSTDDTPSPVSGETILKTYAARHLINSTGIDPKRIFPLLTIADDLGRGGKTVWMSRYEQLDAVLQKASEYTDIGWEVYLDLKNKQLVFDVIPGVDRSVIQSKNSRVFFSTDFENITNLSYAHDVLNLRNLAYAGGVGEGAERTVLKVTNDASEPEGLDRFETFLDCGELEIAETDTSFGLEEEGRHQLLDYQKEESLTATIAPSGSFVYQEQWDLGDLVTVLDRRIGVEQEKRITQITERYEPQSCGIDVTFGTPPANIERVIRSIKNIVR